MKVKDESQWQLFLSEVAADPNPIAEPFRDFVIAWAETAESFMDKRGGNPLAALRGTLRVTEGEVGRWTIGFIGQALVILSTHWEPAGDPDLFVDNLTIIEQNLYFDILGIAQDRLRTQARADEEERD